MVQTLPPIFLALLIPFLVPAQVAGQDIHQASRSGDTVSVRVLLASNPELVQARDDQGRTPLHLAVLAGDRRTLEILLDHGADPNLPAGGGGLSSTELAFQEECRSRSELTRILLSRGGELDLNRRFMERMNALDYAVNGGNPDMVRLVVGLGADVNSTPYHATPLSWASLEGRAEIAQILASAGADVDAPDPLGGVPLRWAVERGHLETVRVLLAHDADTGFLEPIHGRSLLHLATLAGHPELVELLLERGLSVNSTDRHGRTPLDYATRYGHRTVAQRLLNAGAEHGEEAVERFGSSPHLTREMADGEAVAWYMNHRGWVVRTRSHILVFDAEDFGVTRPAEPALANGFLTAEELSLHPVTAFYTVYHGLPGEPAYVHELEDSLPEIRYVHNGRDQWRGSDATVYLDAGADTTVGALRIRTVDVYPALAYLVEVDGVSLYYSGFPVENRARFAETLDPLARTMDRVDVAILAIPDGEGEESGFRDFLAAMNPRALLLLDLERRIQLFPAVAERVAAWGFDAVVFSPDDPGDTFVFRGR